MKTILEPVCGTSINENNLVYGTSINKNNAMTSLWNFNKWK